MSYSENRGDNAPMPRGFRSLKSEWDPKQEYLNMAEASREINMYLMKYYN